MLSRGSRGKIINIASLLSFQGGIRVPSYTAAKSGLAGLTRLLACEWAIKGINVNAIAPGYFETSNTTAPRARGPQRRDPGADSRGTLGQARGDRRRGGISGVGGSRLRSRRGAAGRWWLAGEMSELNVAARFEDDSPPSRSAGV